MNKFQFQSSYNIDFQFQREKERERKMLQIHMFGALKKRKKKDKGDVVYQGCQEVGKQFRKLTTVLNGGSEK